MSLWDDLIGDDSKIAASCEDCCWHQEGTGAEQIRTVLRAADDHIKLGHSVKADVG